MMICKMQKCDDKINQIPTYEQQKKSKGGSNGSRKSSG